MSHTPQPNAATRDVRSRRSPEFHVNNSDTGGSVSATTHHGPQHKNNAFRRQFFLLFFFCCILSICFILPIIFEVIEKNGDEAREFNKLIFVSD